MSAKPAVREAARAREVTDLSVDAPELAQRRATDFPQFPQISARHRPRSGGHCFCWIFLLHEDFLHFLHWSLGYAIGAADLALFRPSRTRSGVKKISAASLFRVLIHRTMQDQFSKLPARREEAQKRGVDRFSLAYHASMGTLRRATQARAIALSANWSTRAAMADGERVRLKLNISPEPAH
jgi:hypothetical protein